MNTTGKNSSPSIRKCKTQHFPLVGMLKCAVLIFCLTFPLTLSTPVKADFNVAVSALKAKNYPLAFKQAIQSAQAGNVEGQKLLGVMYYEGLGTKRNVSEAIKWLEVAAKQGQIDAIVNLAHIYTNEKSGVKNPNKAEKYLISAAEKGDAESQYNLAVHLGRKGVKKPDWGKIFTYLRKSTAQGFIPASHRLGVLYLNGIGVTKNEAQGVKLITSAALKGYPQAEIDYAILVFQGIGVEKNEEIAAAWLLTSANKGNHYAFNRLSRIYWYGRGVKQDHVEAGKWFLLANTAGINDDKLKQLLNKMDDKQKKQAAQRAKIWHDNFKKKLKKRRTARSAAK